MSEHPSLQWSENPELVTRTLEGLLNQKTGIALPWFKTMSEYLNGLRPGELTLLCAATGSGKTELLAGIAAQLFEQKVPFMAAPVETGDADFMARIIGHLSETELNRGEAVPPGVLNKIMNQYGKDLATGKYWITNYDNRVAIEEMLTVIEVLAGQGAKVFLLDNLNFFLKIASTDMEKAVMDEAIHELVVIAKRLQVHILLIVHPRKTDGGKVLSEFDIKGSSTAVQECANVLLFNRPDEEDVKMQRLQWSDRELVFKKIRKRGQLVNRKFYMRFESGRYREFDRHTKTFTADRPNQIARQIQQNEGYMDLV